MKKQTLTALKAGAAPFVLGVAMVSVPAFAQDAADGASEDSMIIVTGSRIARPNLDANSPIAVVTGDQTTAQGDITLDTFLNTLPQVNPAGGTTSNNPPNNGQSNVDLRGLGPNRNIVLINGRRPMVSSSDQTVDLNTIPQGLIQRVEIVTGGAGATYGADAIAGVVNLILKDDFEGLDLRAQYQNSLDKRDAYEYQLSGTAGLNFSEGRGNITVSGEYSKRQGMIKSQRAFAAQASSTTTTSPAGRYIGSADNPIDQAALDAVFGAYGVTGNQVPSPSNIGFNQDGTLFGGGFFNSPINVANFRYDPLGADGAAANQNFFPDFYSYNFDFVNLLVLPLERKSAFGTAKYEFSPAFEVFGQAGWTKYSTATALAPTPVGTTVINPNRQRRVTEATSTLVADAINPATGQPRTISGLIAPMSNPFIPADLRTLLLSRTGDDPNLTGTGADEGIRISKRFLDTGLRQQDLTNEVYQGLIGLRGDITDRWRYEAYYSYGRTTIDQAATGNVNVQQVQALLEAPDGGVSLCAGGFNPFGVNPLSPECVDFINETGFTRTRFTQKIMQAYVAGDLIDLPAGPLGVVLGAERRKFKYTFDPGALFGPIAGFNTSTPDLGTNTFTDFFGELFIPILKDAPWAQSLDLSLGYRRSKSDFNDIQNGVNGKPQNSDAFKAELSWQPIDSLRLRGSYQKSVRAPNFGELFSGGGSFPQYFDPCSNGTAFRASGAEALTLCQTAGAVGGITTPNYVQTPGSQVYLGISGNTDLKPEKGETWTGGLVFSSGRFIASLDYYNIRIKDTIFTPDPNFLIAGCYNYHNTNPTLSAANPLCSGLFRSPDISFISVPVSLGGDGSGYFQSINQGTVKTSGLDFQMAYTMPTEFVGPESELRASVFASYLIDFKVEELPGVVINYAGTASNFAGGLGQSFPRWRTNLNLDWKFSDGITWSSRVRYIDGMKNRFDKIYPGESFTGPKAITYFDTALEFNVDKITFRVGVNNLFNTGPRLYEPNVQSGTDPSLYDVVGRRGFASVRLRY